MSTREVELKLRIPPGAAGRLLRDPALRPLKRKRATTQTLLSVYFDTPQLDLAREGIALRLRRERSRWVQTVKGAADAQSGGGLAVRAEHEWPLDVADGQPRIDFTKLAATPFAGAIEKAVRSGLAPAIVTEFKRSEVPLAFADGTTATLCVDVGEVRARRGRARSAFREPIAEVELELGRGSATRLFELAGSLTDRFALETETRSKLERGVALLVPREARPAHAEPIVLAEASTAADAVASILRSGLRQVEANAAGVLRDDDPEWIHQMRVGIRRLRSALAMLRKRSQPQPLGKELRWLARALGPARDLDVLLLEILPAAKAAARRARDRALAASIDDAAGRARERLQRARADARAAVGSRRFQRLLLASGALASALASPADTARIRAAALSDPAPVFAAALLHRRHRKLVRAADDIATLSAKQRHAARIAAKKLRYTTEAFGSLFPGKRLRSYRKALVRLQEVLGMLNDTAVGVARVEELVGSSAARAFAAWSSAKAEASLPDVDSAWRAFVGTDPFWPPHKRNAG
jgi:inorganic triphosphatase YgiF